MEEGEKNLDVIQKKICGGVKKGKGGGRMRQLGEGDTMVGRVEVTKEGMGCSLGIEVMKGEVVMTREVEGT